MARVGGGMWASAASVGACSLSLLLAEARGVAKIVGRGAPMGRTEEGVCKDGKDGCSETRLSVRWECGSGGEGGRSGASVEDSSTIEAGIGDC
jgi:hypothetical protein